MRPTDRRQAALPASLPPFARHPRPRKATLTVRITGMWRCRSGAVLILTAASPTPTDASRKPNMSSTLRQSDFLPQCTRGIACNAMTCMSHNSGSIGKLCSCLSWVQLCRRIERAEFPEGNTRVRCQRFLR